MRVKITKSKNSESFYIIKSFRHNGKSTSKIIKKLGSINQLLPLHNNSRNEVIAWANEQAAIYTKQDIEDNLVIPIDFHQSKRIEKNVDSLFNGGYLFLKDIFYDLKIDTICKDISNKYKFEYNLTSILEALIYSRILHPSSKLSSFEYSKKFIESPDFDLHHVYRALSVLAKENDFIQNTIYKNSTSVVERNTAILYYDCTNYFFEIEEECDDKKYGKSKENRPNPIIQMGLFMDGNGIPLAFNITPGNMNEQKTLKPTEKKIIKDYGVSKFIVCTDAGLASESNRKFNNKGGRSYIVTQSLKKLKENLKEWALAPTGWTFNGKTYDISEIDNLSQEEQQTFYEGSFYKERWINENGLSQRFIVTYSLKYRDYQQKIRNRQIQRAIKMANSNKVKTHKNANDPARFLIVTNTTENGEIAEETYVDIDQKVIDKEAKYDGFYGVCTTLEDDIQTIIKINQRRWEIEESFRIMKHEFKARPVDVSRKDRIEAHFLTCYLSLLVYRILEKKLDEKYTVSEITKTLTEMNFTHYPAFGYVPTYTRTDITDDLHTMSGFITDTEMLSNKKMKKILQQVKK